MRFRKTYTAVAAALLLMAAAAGCGGRDHGDAGALDSDGARSEAERWARELVNTSRSDTAAMQQCILEAKAAQSRYLVAGSDGRELADEFDTAYREYLEDHAPDLARELFH